MATDWGLRDFIYSLENLDDDEKNLSFSVLDGEGFSGPKKREAFFRLDDADLQTAGISRMGTRKVLRLAMASVAGLGVGSTAGAGAVAAAGPGQGSTAAGGVDNSEEFAERLLKPILAAPPPLDDLEHFLQEPPAAPIPITAIALALTNLPPILQSYFTTAWGQLAHAVGTSLASPLTQGGSEIWTVIAEHVVVVSLLLELDNALPPHLRIGLVPERDQGDATSLMTVKSLGGSSLRPDGVLRGNSGRRLLAKWEDKAASMEEAVEDLRKKTAAWTPLYYGDIAYLPCFAASGSNLQFYAISRAGGIVSPRAVSPRYNLAKMADRARAVMATIKFYQLLCAQRERYPVDVLPAGAVLRAHGPGFTRELLFRTDELAVRKRVSPWPAFASWCGVDFTQLVELYRATAKRPGLVHAMEGAPTLQNSLYSVDLIPVGLQSSNALPATEDDARRLVHGLLHGLAAIHEAKFVHRDLRWDNFACSPGPSSSRRWFLLDLETCAPADQQPLPAFQPVGWHPSTTLVAGRYTQASDLFQLGLALQPKCEQVVSSVEGKAFLNAILTPPASQERSAQQLLEYDWLRCEGDGICRAAGAQPDER